MTSNRRLSSREVALKYGFRSGLEEALSAQLEHAGVAARFEAFRIPYRLEKSCTYTPDFLLPNGIVVEGKGRFETADRMKHLLIKGQHPDIDIRFVFSRSGEKIAKGSKTTYAMWATREGFEYADKVIPQEWMKEPRNRQSLSAVRALFEEQRRDWPF